MKMYETNDGDRYAANTPAELVTAMRQDSRMLADQTDEVFMLETAKRVHKMTGETVATTSAEAFVADLERIGYVKLASKKKRA